MVTSRRESSSVYSDSQTPQPSTGFNFAPASLPGVPQQYPFVPHPSRQSNAELAPEFPSSLHSMESSNSELVSEQEHKRPVSVTSDTGTYTCTYQGCNLRFETPTKLQKHKKEGHRQPAAMAGRGSSSTRNGADGVARNSQAGPHKCERINPSTGRPCNTIFSRPYDLTRHEDTIHNARHQKQRCSICTDVKTFSRSDALTRHYRVVHPDVEPRGRSSKRKNNE